MKKHFISIILMLSVCAMTVLGGCSGGTNNESSQGNTSQEPVYGGSVVVGIQQDIDSLDPHKATAAGTKEILFNIFEGLVKPDENGNLTNAVASDYSISDDGLVYTFTIRDGVKFHNGETVTAKDVKYSLDRVAGLLDGQAALVSTFKTVKSVDIIDDNKVQVTVGAANTEFIYSFTAATAAIIPYGSADKEAAKPIGTGPFKFVSYAPQEGIVVEKNNDYWQSGVPYLDKVTFKIVNSSESALLDLQGGSIDIYPYLTDSQATQLAGKFNVSHAASDVVQALFLNNNTEPFNNEKVRQAVCYALDNDSTNSFVSGGNGTVISTAMLPTLKDYYVDLNNVYGTKANIEKAKSLLTEAGFPNGFDMTITVPSNYEFHVETAQVVAEQLKAVGINATINTVEWNTWLSECYNGRNYQSTISGITCDMTPGYLLNRFVSSSAKNFINFNDSEYDEEYKKAQEATDLKEKAAHYSRLQHIITEKAGTAFIQVAPITVAINTKLAGYKFYPVYVQDMSSVYFTK